MNSKFYAVHQGWAASRTPRRFPRPWGVGVGRVALATQPVYLGNEVSAFLGQDIQVPLCYYLTTQGTGLLLQLKERQPCGTRGRCAGRSRGMASAGSSSVKKMRPAAITYDQHWAVIRQQQRDGSALVRQRGPGGEPNA